MTAPTTVPRPRPRWPTPAFTRIAAVVIVAAVAGFLVIGQVQRPPEPGEVLAAETEEDLTRILADLNAEADALQEEIGLLRLQLNELQQSSQSAAAAASAREEQLRSLQVLAGTVPVTGPGITITVADPERAVRYESLIDVVQELRDAGAEAIAVNNTRVAATSAFSQSDGRITLDGEVLAPPFRIAAIGQPATLEGGLKIPGGAVDAVQALRSSVAVTVERHARVDIPALARTPTFDAAIPVGSKP